MTMITAQEAADSGLMPAAFFSIAKFHFAAGNDDTAHQARRVAKELAGILRVDIGGRKLRHANDNRKAAAYGKPRNRRVA